MTPDVSRTSLAEDDADRLASALQNVLMTANEWWLEASDALAAHDDAVKRRIR